MAGRKSIANAGFARWLALALALVLADQLTKQAVLLSFRTGERLPIIAGFFDLTLLFNRGAAFSLLADAGGWQRRFFIGIGVAATLFITIGAVLLIVDELLRVRRAR